MKKLKYRMLIFGMTVLTTGISVAQVNKKTLLLGLAYYNENNRTQYLKANIKTKIEGKFTPVAGADVHFYISSESPAHLLGTAKTDNKGETVLMIPPSARDEWNKSPKQTFLALVDSSQMYGAVTTTIELTKAKIKLDTAADKTIVATLLEQQESNWVPVKEVDMRIAVKRLGADLNVNETPTFTTDSLGTATAEFKLPNLPGDSLGNLVLIARVDDNDLYGNLSAEKIVPWGSSTRYSSNFNQRSLFARRGYSPYWLIAMATGITGAVWFILFYLFLQIRKIKKLGAGA
jgi:hypothetical protein